MDGPGQGIDQLICGFDLTIGRSLSPWKLRCPASPPGAAQAIGASLGLGLVLARG